MGRPAIACLLSLAAATAFPGVVLDVSVLHRKGIDTGLVLQSEVHSKEEILGDREISVGPKDGPRVLVRAGLVNDFSAYGPSALVGVAVRAVSADGAEMEAVGGTAARIPMGERREFQFREGPSQLVEAAVVPRMR